jgi:hypothetical protein
MTDNELIAEFMGLMVRKWDNNLLYTCDEDGWVDFDSAVSFSPDRNWNQLIPVAQRIKEIVFSNIKEQSLHSFKEAVSRWHPVRNEIGNLKIEAAHYCIVMFIKWHNSQSK